MALSPPTSPIARDFASVLADIEQRLTAIEVGLRTGQLGNSSLENSGLNSYDSNGNLRYTVGLQPDGNYAAVSMNNPNPPPVPGTPTVEPQIAGLKITYEGDTADGIGLPTDWARANVYIAPPSMLWAKVGTILSSDGKGVFIAAPLEYQQYSVRLTNVNLSGKESDPGGIAQGTPVQVVGTDLINGIIDQTKLAADSVTAAAIAANSIGSAKLQDGSVQLAKLADGSVSASKIIDGAVQSGKIAASAVGANEIAANSIVSGNIATDAIQARNVLAGAIQAGKIAVDGVQAGNIVAGAVTTDKIAALNITGDKIAANAITAGNINAGAITASKLQSDLIIASRIIAGDANGARVELHPSYGLQGYKADGTTRTLWADAATGNLTLLGSFTTAPSGQRIVINAGGVVPDTIQIYSNSGPDYGRIMARTANDGSAAVLIDGGASGGNPRGRIGVYKGEAFLSYCTDASAGDTSAGYSRTAVSCNTSDIGSWVQNKFFWSKYSGSSQVANSSLWLMWSAGGVSNCPTFGATVQDSGIKFDSGQISITNAIGTLFGPCKASAFPTSTSQTSNKTDIMDIKQVLAPLETIAAAPSKAFKLNDDIAVDGNLQRFGPMVESLPNALKWPTINPDGSQGYTIELSSMMGVLWSAVSQLLARRITSTTATCVVPAGTILTAGSTKEVTCTWESSPLATPTDALVFLNAGLLGAGKVTAWVKTGSVTSTGCTVVFKNTSSSSVIAATAAVAGLTSLTATVIGQALYTPPDATY